MPRSRYEDDEDEIRPRRASSRYEEEEEEERPRRRAVARDDDDDTDDRPRRRTRARDEEADDDRPRRRAPRDDDDDDDDRPRGRRRRDADDEEDERPKPRSRSRSGWGAATRVKEADSAFASRLKLDEDPVIVKFLEDKPYVSYRSHWLEGRKGQKSFTCLSDEHPKGCPLCDAGQRSTARSSFNVVLLSPEDEPVLKSYEVGARVLDQLKNFNEDARQGPLSKHYWAISRTGKGGSTATSHQMVKERDLEEWDLEPLTDEELDEFADKAYTEDILQMPTRKELLALVDEELDD